MYHIVLLLGSNLGNKIDNIEKALTEIEKNVGKITKKTKITTTKPWGFESFNNFENCAIEVTTKLSPIQLLKTIKNFELKLGRIDIKNQNYQDRIIDIDIIYYENIIFWSQKLIIPHFLHVKKRNFSKKLLKELKNIDN